MRDLRSRWNLVVVVLAVLTMVGCGALQADPRTAQQNQRGNTGLAANGRGLFFGSVVVGNHVEATQYVYNLTNSTVYDYERNFEHGRLSSGLAVVSGNGCSAARNRSGLQLHTERRRASPPAISDYQRRVNSPA